ncbi:MAG TPA: hypothetical protein DCL08_02980, partial [Anaerolineaceae bacterium]|nr:hypothetical protein [Anaerolineaceae bacterium]
SLHYYFFSLGWLDELIFSFERLVFALLSVIQTNRMTNPPFFNYRSVFGCWWVVMKYLYGEGDCGIQSELMSHVSSPTHSTNVVMIGLLWPSLV